MRLKSLLSSFLFAVEMTLLYAIYMPSMHSAVPGDVIVELMQHLKVIKNFPPVQVWLAKCKYHQKLYFQEGAAKMKGSAQ